MIDVDYDRRHIVETVERHIANGSYPSEVLYGDGAAGARVANLLAEVPLIIKKQITY